MSEQPPVYCVLRCPVVQQRVGMSRSTLYDRINPKSPRFDPTFPKPIRLGGSSIGWIEHEIQTWLEHRMAQR